MIEVKKSVPKFLSLEAVKDRFLKNTSIISV